MRDLALQLVCSFIVVAFFAILTIAALAFVLGRAVSFPPVPTVAMLGVASVAVRQLLFGKKP